MKKLFYLLLIPVFIYSCGSQGDQSSTREESGKAETIDPANLQTIEIDVYGMTCNGCELTVESAVKKLPGVQSVKASHTDSSAVITFDKTRADFKTLETAITATGYKVENYRLK
jgi:copper chaperone CopZ